jgi:hypothetical protein
MVEIEEVRRAYVPVYNRVHSMMNDDYNDPYKQETSSSIGRWVVFGVLLILGPIGVIGITMLMPPEFVFLYMFFYTPMVVFGLYATYRWAQGRTIAPTNASEDDRILESMRKHALPAQISSQSDTIRCENCGNPFLYVNAIPVEENIVLCPFCDTRLHVT